MLFSGQPHGRAGRRLAGATAWLGRPFFRARFLAASAQPRVDSAVELGERYRLGWTAVHILWPRPETPRDAGQPSGRPVLR